MLTTVSVLRSCPLAGYTLREVAAIPPLPMAQRSSPRASSSKTKGTAVRTYTDMLPWPGFLEGARAVHQSLDNTNRLYAAPHSSGIQGKQLPAAADEAEIRAYVLRFAEIVNDICELLGIPVECVGGGSWRRRLRTDMVIRSTVMPAPTESSIGANPAILSSRNHGAGEVKAPWQYSLLPGESLTAAVHNPKRIRNVLPATQQVGMHPFFVEAAVHDHDLLPHGTCVAKIG